MNQKLLFLIFIAQGILELKAEEVFSSPTPEELMSVNLGTLDYSLHITQTKKADCNEQDSVFTKIPKSSTNEVFCYCDTDIKSVSKKDSNLKLNKDFPFLGEIQFIDYKISNGNDNLLNGVLQYSPYLSRFDGDDRGRTFGIENEFTLTGDRGVLSLSANSYGLSKFTNKSTSASYRLGDRPINYLEVNTLGFRLDSILNKEDYLSGLESSNYSIATINYEQTTQDGKYSKELQRWWHSQFKDFIQYDYVKEEEDEKNLKIMAGVGKEWISEIGKWKCATKAEIQVGMSLSSSQPTERKRMMSSELSVNGALNISHSSAPWLALSLWLQGSKGNEGPSKDGGIEVSFPIKKANYIIKPFIGIQRHSSDRDKKYGNANENYHVFGVVIKY